MRIRSHALFTAAIVTVAAIGQSIASAGTFPGTNGKIAFSSDGEILVIRSDGTGRANLTNTGVGSETQPAWNATGKKLVFTDADHAFGTMSADGSNRKDLVSHNTFAGNATWSADGSTIAFDGFIDTIEGNRIFVVPAAGGTATQLLDLDAQDPTYSPDGTKIAYEDGFGNSDIGVMNADGSGAATITTGDDGNAGDFDPSWSPDGTKIAFKRDHQIWTMSATGSAATQLTTGTPAEHPTWSRDGTKIAFQRDEDIWVMDSDGSDVVNITNTPDEEDRQPDWGGTGGALPPSEGIGFSATSYEGSENGGDARSLLGAAITLVRTGSTSGTATVAFTTSDGTAKSSSTRECKACNVPPPDYLKASGVLVFAAGETTKSFRVPITDDGAVENDETVNLTLSAAKGGAAPGPITTAVLTISDNDPNISFERAASSGSEEVTSPRLNVLLSSPASGATVAYTVTGGTAVAGEDFTLAAGTLRFSARSPSIPLTVLDENLKEGSETVVVELSSPTHAELGPITRHTYTIKDDDPSGDTAGDTTTSARAVDLVAQPRQVIRESLSPSNDMDMFRVQLDAGDDVAIDVDPGGRLEFDALTESTLTIIGPDGTTVLATVGRSKEPDGSGSTDNPAYLLHAEAAGTYYLRLSTDQRRLNGYSLELHRLALAEGFQEPAILDDEGPMFAWLRGDTLGITGPTGYGFALKGAWTEATTVNKRSGNSTSVYTLATGETVDLATAFGDLRLQSLGPIVVTTGENQWGDLFGKVADAIPLRLGIPLGALADTMREEFGLTLAVSALERWTIAMGSEIMAGGRGVPDGVEQLMPGVPYLWFNDEPAITAILGDVAIEYEVGQQKVLLILDPIDPFIYIRSEEAGEVKKPTLAFSRGGRIPFHPDLQPTISSAVGVTDFYSHVFTSAGVPPNPALAEYITIFADGALDVDANDDGTWLAGKGNADQLFNGDLSAFGEVLQDINVGANARVIFHYDSDRNQFDFETPLGRATAVYNGQEETFWFRGRKGPENSPLDGTPFEFLNLTQEDFFEGTINSDGEFSVIGGTSFVSPAAEFVIELRLDNDGIEADVRGDVEMKGSIEYKGASASCKATASARGLLAFSYSNGLHMSGSVGLDGSVKCYVGNNKVASASIDLSGSIDDGKLEFRLPLIGKKSVTLF
ncbi:MAG: hypothetical protein QOG04_1614 [Actinomycetota bacterium]|nr:hypothetical protein [Actinomycetota bacterium]